MLSSGVKGVWCGRDRWTGESTGSPLITRTSGAHGRVAIYRSQAWRECGIGVVMKIFLSSTFLDLIGEREAVLKALSRKRLSALAMEYFLATPTTPTETALENLRKSDVMILVIGFKAGSLLPDGSGRTYTWEEYEELLRLGKEPLVFVKQERGWLRRQPSWKNKERGAKKRALDEFRACVGQRHTWDYFQTPDQLALAVVEALDLWEAKGRAGARKTFSSTEDYFVSKNPAGHFQLLDFGTTMLGRDEQIRSLNDFATSNHERVCILSGRGGIGKSKILHDWVAQHPDECVFLKDEPFWHEDSEKEIPITCRVLVVDDAHRQVSFGKVLQLVRDTAKHRNLKLVVSSRPGSAVHLAQQVFKHIDSSQVIQLPALQELTRPESRMLAEQVLGEGFRSYAPQLADIGNNSPLVIVAGGRLIATRKIDPLTLTNLEEFRSSIFNRLLDEMELHGPSFPIDPPLQVLHLIAALGPVDVEQQDFQEAAHALFERPVDEILSTIDALSSTGIVTPRPKPVRVTPDVLSDWLLEDRSIGPGNRSTGYANRLYSFFGAHSLKNLMRNFAELDWRRGQAGETGLNLLDQIWTDIHARFRHGDDYARHSILTELAPAAIYQPDNVIALVRTAIDQAASDGPPGGWNLFRPGPAYLLSALPDLLAATAQHPDRLRESVTILWGLTKKEPKHGSSARATLKRLAAWHRYGDPALNFAMLVQAIQLTHRDDAFTGEYTPFELINQVLEREGEFSEWQDEATMSFGGFGLNYLAVGPVRESALDYLDFALAGDGNPALHAVKIVRHLLPNHLNRMGEPSTEHEMEWQHRERERCLSALLKRCEHHASPLLRARIHDAIRSATAINCPLPISEAATAALASLVLSDAAAVVDAICTDSHDLPQLSREFSGERWEQAINEVMLNGKSRLERLIEGTDNQVHFVIDQTEQCIDAHVGTGGFHRFMLALTERPDFLKAMADRIIAHPRLDMMVPHLSSVLNAIHWKDPGAFRVGALAALESGAVEVIHAYANTLRVFEGATEDDAAVIHAYAGYPDSVAKQGAISAIAYMGKFTDLRQSLKAAALSIHTDGNKAIAAELPNTFGPYGVPLTDLTHEEASQVALEFLLVHDWGLHQGAVLRFLGHFVSLFPDQTYDLLIQRIELSRQAREDNQPGLRGLRWVKDDISFGDVTVERRLALGRDCIAKIFNSDSGGDYAELFWAVAGYEHGALNLIQESCHGLNDQGVQNLATLIGKAIPRLAFFNREFVKNLLQQFSGDQRQRLVYAFAHQSRRHGGGVFAGSPEQYMAEESRQFRNEVESFPDEPGFEDLATAIRRLV